MTRFLKISFLTMLCVVLVAGTAMAAGTLAAPQGGSPNINVALEAMNAPRLFSIPAGANQITGGSIVFTPSQSLSTAQSITVSFTNMGFRGDIVSLCEVTNSADGSANGSTVIGQATTTANATSQTFGVISPAPIGSIFITDNGVASGAITCNGTTGTLSVNFAPTAITSATMATVSFTDTVGDAPTAVEVANIARQYSTSYTAANSSLIDFISTGAAGNLFQVTAGATNTIPDPAVVTVTNSSATFTINTTSAPASLAVSALLNLQDSASWQGVADVYVQQGACTGFITTVAGNNNAANLVAAGTGNVALTFATGAFNGVSPNSGTTAANICIDVNGAILNSRNISGALTVKAGANNPFADTTRVLETWTPNGFQAFIPGINANNPVYCLVTNKGTSAASAVTDILSSESGATLQSALSLGTIGAGKTLRVDYNGQSLITYAYGSSAETGTTTALTIASNDRYVADIKVGASPANVVVQCTTGSGTTFWTVPVLKNTNVNNGYSLE